MKPAKVNFALLLLVLSLGLTGCAGLPSSGPIAQEVSSQENQDSSQGGYIVVDIDERIASITSSQPRDSFARVFHNTGPAPDLRVGVGDSVVVTIYEAAAGGLFSAGVSDRSATAGSRTAAIPGPVVARDRTIAVPYAGRPAGGGHAAEQRRRRRRKGAGREGDPAASGCDHYEKLQQPRDGRRRSGRR